MRRLWVILMGCLVWALLAPAAATAAARPMIEIKDDKADTVRGPSMGAGGPTLKFKRASGPMDFGGEMFHWGLRIFGGRPDDPRLGVAGSIGILNGNSMRLSVGMGGITLEDYYWRDMNFKWRVGLGGGGYELKTIVGQKTLAKGNFTYFEPQLVWVLPIKRSIHLEFSAGYFFAGVLPVKLEGLTLEANLLIGRF